MAFSLYLISRGLQRSPSRTCIAVHPFFASPSFSSRVADSVESQPFASLGGSVSLLASFSRLFLFNHLIWIWGLNCTYTYILCMSPSDSSKKSEEKQEGREKNRPLRRSHFCDTCTRHLIFLFRKQLYRNWEKWQISKYLSQWPVPGVIRGDSGSERTHTELLFCCRGGGLVRFQ